VRFHNVQTLEDLALEGFLEKKTVFGLWFPLHFKSFVTTIGSCHKEFASETMPTFAHKGKVLEVVGSTRQLWVLVLKLPGLQSLLDNLGDFQIPCQPRHQKLIDVSQSFGNQTQEQEILGQDSHNVPPKNTVDPFLAVSNPRFFDVAIGLDETLGVGFSKHVVYALVVVVASCVVVSSFPRRPRQQQVTEFFKEWDTVFGVGCSFVRRRFYDVHR